MKITINPDNLICDENYQVFHKVRAIIENEAGEFIITNEGETNIASKKTIDKFIGHLNALVPFMHEGIMEYIYWIDIKKV